MKINPQKALHEVNAVSQAIRKACEVTIISLRGNCDLEAIRFHTESIAQNVNRLEFWTMIGLSGGEFFESAPTSVNFHQEFTSVSACYKRVLAERNVTASIRPKKGIGFIGTHAAAAHIPFILFENAAKYAVPSSSVSVELVHRGAHLEIEACNRGLLVAESELLSLFEEGYRGHLARTSGAPGEGLGLFILKNIVEAAGGSVAVNSTPIAVKVNGSEVGEFSIQISIPDLYAE